jgi:hypothetical protein
MRVEVWNEERGGDFMKRNCRIVLAAAGLAVLAFSSCLFAQSAKQQGAAKDPAQDFTGVWRRTRRPPDNTRQYSTFELVFSFMSPNPPMTPWAEEKYEAARPDAGPRGVSLLETNDPVNNCFPPGVPRIYLVRGLPFEIMQDHGKVVMLFEYDHFVRQIFTDGRQHPQDMVPSWMGDSIGKWEGDTLVVDTVGFNDKTWLDQVGHPHSEDLHLVERIRRVSQDALSIDITIDDPKAYTKPWVVHLNYDLKPGWNIGEEVCEDNVNFLGVEKQAESGK